MKSIKRVIALALAITMMLSCYASVFAFSDIPADLNTEVNVLNKLGIFVGYPDGSFKPEGTISREEAATVICRLVGAEDVGKIKVGTNYSDVDAERWSSGYIATATNLGIIDGFPDGTYQPEAQITYEQMSKLLVAALGYRSMAEANGGYPTGYLYIASTSGLNKGVEGSAGSDALRGIVAKLTYNALDIPLMTRETYGDEEKYVVQDGVNTQHRITVLSRYFDIAKLAGFVVTNEVNGLKEGTVGFVITDNFKSEFAQFADSAVIDGLGETFHTFNVGETDAMDYLGKPVIAFVKVSGTTLQYSEIVAINENPQGDELVLDASQIKDYEEDNKGKLTITWNELSDTDKEHTFTLDGNEETILVPVIYNGAFSGMTLTEFIDDNNIDGSQMYATFTFIKASAKTKYSYDVVFIEEYETLVYKETETDEDAETKTLIGKGSESQYLLTELLYEGKNIKTSFVDTKGEAFDVADLKENDILTVIETIGADYDYYKVIVSRDTVDGVIEEVANEGIRQEVTIDGKLYYVATDVEYIEDDAGTFHVDANGRLAFYARTNSSNKYAYIIDGFAKDSGEEKVKLFDENGKEVTLRLAETYTVNGTKNGAVDGDQIIRYVTDDGKITKIFTEDGSRELLPVENANGAATYRSNGDNTRFIFADATVKISADTLIFCVDAAKDVLDWSVIKASDLDDDTAIVDAIAYNKDGSDKAAVVWIIDAQPENKLTNNTLMISKVESKKYDGSNVFQFTFFNSTKFGSQTIYTYDRSADYDRNAGEIIKFKTDADGLVARAEAIITWDAGELVLGDGLAFVGATSYVDGLTDSEKVEYVFGEVTNVKDDTTVTVGGKDYDLYGMNATFYAEGKVTSKKPAKFTDDDDYVVFLKIYDENVVDAYAYVNYVMAD